MNPQELIDFHASLGDEIATHLEGFVDPQYLDLNEALEPLYLRYGTEFTPTDICKLSATELSQLTQEYNNYFEVKTITKDLVIAFPRAALWRWDNLELEIQDED